MTFRKDHSEKGAAAVPQGTFGRTTAPTPTIGPLGNQDMQRTLEPAAMAREAADEAEANDFAQRASVGPAAEADGTAGSHQLSVPLRSAYERQLGVPLGNVRIAAGGSATSRAARMGARAFTDGQEIVFGDGEWNPATESGQRLLAHEFAHVKQLASSSLHTIRRQSSGATPDPNANQDEKLVKRLEVAQALGINPINTALEVGGLNAWSRSYPMSFAHLRRIASAHYGDAVVGVLVKEDATILSLAQRSNEVQGKLQKLEAAYARHRQAAISIVRYFADFYSVDYQIVAGWFQRDPSTDLRLLVTLLDRDPDAVAKSVQDDADLAQADADTLERQREEWTEQGETVLGNEVATREGWVFNDKISLKSLLPPTYGADNVNEAIAIARLAGMASAVLQVGSRYYGYALSEQYSRSDLMEMKAMPARTKVVRSGVSGDAAIALVATDGWVVKTEGGLRFFGNSQASDPESYLAADTNLLESGKAEEFNLALLPLFQSMLMNLALVNLKGAEGRLTGIQKEMQRNSMSPAPEAGAALKRDTARLRDLTLQIENLSRTAANEALTDKQLDERDAILTEIARVVQRNPAAGLFVKNTRDPEDKRPVDDSQIQDRLKNEEDGDAAALAFNEARRRKENIETVRQALFDNPSLALDFDVLHPAVLARFSEDQQRAIKVDLVFHTIDKAASIVPILAADLVLLIAGFVTGGATWLGLAVHGAGTAFGAYQASGQIKNAELLASMSALDIEGGFALSTPGEASSARNWALVATAMNFLAFAGLARSAGKLFQASAREATAMARVAKRAGVAEEVLSAALRRNWRGLPDPDPAALRKILLAPLGPVLERQYANIPIRVLTEEAWAAEFGANSTAHAVTRFGTNPAGETVASSVLFRRAGSVMALQEEAEHIAQAADPRWAKRVQQLANLTKEGWETLPAAEKLRATRSALEIEQDAQRTLLARAQVAGDAEGADNAFEEIEELSQRVRDIDDKIANPSSRSLYRWFDPEHPPGLFNRPRLPRQPGTWNGVPGNSNWMSERPEVIKYTGKVGVRFRNGYPNFQPWSVAQVSVGEMSGYADDFAEADALLARRFAKSPPEGMNGAQFLHNGEPNAAALKRFRQTMGLTWHHHQGGKLMLLVPTELHANIPHTGGASAARAAGP
jgi:hypothetical protein